MLLHPIIAIPTRHGVIYSLFSNSIKYENKEESKLGNNYSYAYNSHMPQIFYMSSYFSAFPDVLGLRYATLSLSYRTGAEDDLEHRVNIFLSLLLLLLGLKGGVVFC
mmetsp:Transcript_9619/g.14480  ORF Transcript_9619/g.14480 Transcript_9619/m.14480 type:complete len:107 (-) Transcript_9619:1033-1353(-)